MTDVRFYHLTRSRLEDALPVMLKRTLQRQGRAVVRFADTAALKAMDERLWTFDEAEFIPHGHEQTGFADQQPVWLTLGLDNPAEATFLFVTEGAEIAHFETYDVCAVLFDGRLEQSVQAARVLWKDIRDSMQTPPKEGAKEGAKEGSEEGFEAHSLTYWQQNDQGGWVDKTKKDA